MNDKVDVLDIREELMNLIDHAPAGGFWHDAIAQPAVRNSFCLRLRENGTIYTVTVTVGGMISQ